ncbi:unnamed protein product [Rotaria sordida]|uniref:DUF4590 domain-containing protein n=1 Tax=Rotaria sordida TaxID=392033 RepID=A0A815K6Z9_9BILA|nr:unnamed protein product [Rotaria sordida]
MCTLKGRTRKEISLINSKQNKKIVMTDLQKPNNNQIDPKLNIYFQNKRIRRHLIAAGLINRQGEILPTKNTEIILPQRSKQRRRQLSADKLSKAVHHYILEDEQKGRVHIRNQFDFSVKHVHKEKKPESKHTTRQGISQSSLNVHHSPTITKKKRSPIRAKSANHSLHESRNRSARYSAKDKSRNNKERHRVVMIYYGPQTIIDYNIAWCQPDGDEIVVSQQHCGGENLIVFKGYVKPNETFEFESRRHQDYPFALAFYVNGLIDSRLSTCCEYRHKRNIPLGGKHGLFGIIDIKNIKPCRYCRHKKYRKKSRSNVSLGLQPSRYRSSFAPRFLLRSQSNSPERQQTPSPSHGPIIVKDHSPDISRTPTPPVAEDNKKSRISSANRNSPIVPNDQNITTTLNNDEENYLSDFDETNDDDLPPSTSRFGRPRISDSHSIDNNQRDTNTSSRTSSIIFKKSAPSKNEDNYNQSKAIDHSRKSSSTISKRSDFFDDENDHYKSTIQTQNNNDADSNSLNRFFKKSGPSKDENNYDLLNEKNQSRKSSSTLSKKSDHSDNENDHHKSTKLTTKNNDIDNLRRSSSSTLKKSGPSKDETNYDLLDILVGKNKPASHLRKSSSSTSKNSDLSEDENDYYKSTTPTKINNDADISSSSSHSTIKKSDLSKNEDNYELSDLLNRRNHTAGYSRKSSSSISKASDRLNDENDHYKSTIPTKQNNDADNLPRSSSSTSRKSDSSSRYEYQKESNEKTINNTNDNQFSSTTTTTQKNNIGNRRTTSDSENDAFKALFAKKPQDTDYSSNFRRVSTNSTDDIFGTKNFPSSKKDKDIPIFSKDWFETNNKIDRDDNANTSYDSNSNTRPWRKDSSSDENGTYII